MLRNSNFSDSIRADRTQRRRFEDRVSLRAQRREEQFRKRRKLRNESENANVEVPTKPVVSPQKANLQDISNLRKFLCNEHCEIQPILDNGYVDVLLQILKCKGSSLLKVESAWCISLLTASGNPSSGTKIVNAGGIPTLLQILHEESREDLLDHTLTCLGNLAADSVEFRKQILALNGCVLLLNIFASSHDNLELILTASWTLAMLVQSNITKQLIPTCLSLCQKMLEVDNHELWTQAVWIVRNLFHDLNLLEAFIGPLASSGILPAIVDIIDYPIEEIRIACLVCCEHLLNVEGLVDHLLEAGLLQKLRDVLQDTDPQFDALTRKSFQIESLRTLAWVPYSTKSVQSMLNLDFVRIIFNVAKLGSFEIRRETINVMLSLLEVGSNKQVAKMVGFGVIKFLREQLRLAQPATDELCLHCLQAILEVGQKFTKDSSKNAYAFKCEEFGIVEQVLRMENSENKELSEFADHLLESYLQ